MRVSSATVIIAIIALAAIELYALHQGIDGLALTAVVGAIAGLGGFKIKEAITTRQGNKESGTATRKEEP